jgi:hypothetical protein
MRSLKEEFKAAPIWPCAALPTPASGVYLQQDVVPRQAPQA